MSKATRNAARIEAANLSNPIESTVILSPETLAVIEETPSVAKSYLSVAPKATRENATRETAAQRQLRASKLFADGAITFLGRLSDEQSQEVISGGTVELVENVLLSIADDKAAKCILCGGTHTTASKRNQLTTWYKSATQMFALSDTCREVYVAPIAHKAIVNLSSYRTTFPKAVIR